MHTKISGKRERGAQQDITIMYSTYTLDHPLTHTYKHMRLSECTYIDVVLLVTLVQVVHDGGLVQLSQR